MTRGVPSWTCDACGFVGNLRTDESCFVCHHRRASSPDPVPAIGASPPPETPDAQVRRSPSLLAVGLLVAVVAVAVGGALFAAESLVGESPSASPDAAVAGDVSEPSRTPSPSDSPGTHTVRAGETLFSIASHLGVSEAQLRWWNLDRFPSLRTNPQDIAVGWVLTTTGEPMPTPTPRPTPRPTPVPAAPPVTQPGPGGGGGGSTWIPYNAYVATAYRSDVELTYVNDMQKARFDISVAEFYAPGLTFAERAARREEALLEAAYFIATSINEHFLFMNTYRPSSCFADAYQADYPVGMAFYNAAKYMSEHHGDDAGLLAAAFDVRDPFLAGLDGYFSDC